MWIGLFLEVWCASTMLGCIISFARLFLLPSALPLDQLTDMPARFFDKHIFLEVFVKGDKDWRSSQKELNNFGYNPE